MSAAFEPTPEDRALVETLSGYGIPHEGIAKLVKIHVQTLRAHFADELENGVLKANAAVAGNLFRMATGEGKSAAVAAFFWLKTRARWSEAPQDVNVTVRDDTRNAEERARAMALVLAKRGQAADGAGRPH